MKKYSLILILLILVGISNGFAQLTLTLNEQESYLRVKGTSSLHDWEMLASELSGKVIIKKSGGGLEGFEEVSLNLKSKALLSNNSTMDSKAHDALKAKVHPEIKFSMISYEIVNGSNGNYQGTILGKLTVAGKTKNVSIPFNGLTSAINSLTVTGNKAFKMTDFGIDPPRAMLGALKTGDEVNVEYKFGFIENPESNLGKK